MLISSGERRLVNIPIVPFLIGFLTGTYIAHQFTGFSLPLTLSVELPVGVLAGLMFAFPWALLFYRDGDDLVVRSLLRTQRIRVTGSRYRLDKNQLQLCRSSDKECVAILPYPFERTPAVVEKLHRNLGLPAELDTSFVQSETRKRRGEIIVGTCVVLMLLIWFVIVSQKTCDPGSDCSAFGILSKLFSGIRELIGL